MTGNQFQIAVLVGIAFIALLLYECARALRAIAEHTYQVARPQYEADRERAANLSN